MQLHIDMIFHRFFGLNGSPWLKLSRARCSPPYFLIGWTSSLALSLYYVQNVTRSLTSWRGREAMIIFCNGRWRLKRWRVLKRSCTIHRSFPCVPNHTFVVRLGEGALVRWHFMQLVKAFLKALFPSLNTNALTSFFWIQCSQISFHRTIIDVQDYSDRWRKQLLLVKQHWHRPLTRKEPDTGISIRQFLRMDSRR